MLQKSWLKVTPATSGWYGWQGAGHFSQGETKADQTYSFRQGRTVRRFLRAQPPCFTLLLAYVL